MSLPKFDYFSPRSVEEAVMYLAEHRDEGATILAGGTDLLVNMRGKAIPDGHRPRCQQHRTGPWQARHLPDTKPGVLVALSRIPGLRYIEQVADEIRIGAMTTHTDLETSPLVREHLAGLADGAYQLGSPLCRNRGTYGGNLCNARPASDTSIPTMALNGTLVLTSIRGERIVAHEDFVTAPGRTVLEPDEIVREIRFRLPVERYRSSAYIKLANRKALEIAVVGAAAAVEFAAPPQQNGSGWRGGVIAEARIVLASVAPKPVLIGAAAEYLSGKELTADVIGRTAEICSSAVKPITDHRGSAKYRRLMVGIIVRRTLRRCVDRCIAGELEMMR